MSADLDCVIDGIMAARSSVRELKRMLEDGARNPVAYKRMQGLATSAHEDLVKCLGVLHPLPVTQR